MKCLVIALSLLLAQVQQSSAVELKFVTEPYQPFSFIGLDDAPAGAGVETVIALMKGMDVPFTIEIMPWARAIALAETQPTNCVFATARTLERENRFSWISPIYIDRNLLVANAKSGLHPDTINAAKAYTIGTQREDYTEGLLRTMGFPKIDLSSSIDVTLAKLLGERIDLMPMSAGVYEKLRKEGQPVHAVLTLTEQTLAVACNKQVPVDVIEKMQAGLDQAIKSGAVRQIYQKYELDTSWLDTLPKKD